MLKRIFLGFLLAIVLLVAVVAVKTWTTRSQQTAVAPAAKLDIDVQAAARRLATAITFRTVSGLQDPAASAAEFDKLHAYLEAQFPKVHATLKREVVRQNFPDAVVAPGLMIAATDSRHFSLVSDAVFRFSPFRLKGEDLARIHGTNERLALANYGEMISFYHQLLSNTKAARAT
jgi:hypothetical protein